MSKAAAFAKRRFSIRWDWRDWSIGTGSIRSINSCSPACCGIWVALPNGPLVIPNHFATPSVYLPAANMGETAQWLLPLNPAYGLILAFRQAALGAPVDAYAFGVSAAVGLLVATIGVLYFRRVERTFADDI